jgi:hypothetical protein
MKSKEDLEISVSGTAGPDHEQSKQSPPRHHEEWRPSGPEYQKPPIGSRSSSMAAGVAGDPGSVGHPALAGDRMQHWHEGRRGASRGGPLRCKGCWIGVGAGQNGRARTRRRGPVDMDQEQQDEAGRGNGLIPLASRCRGGPGRPGPGVSDQARATVQGRSR